MSSLYRNNTSVTMVVRFLYVCTDCDWRYLNVCYQEHVMCYKVYMYIFIFIKALLATARSNFAVHPFVRLSACCQNAYTKMQFSQKLSTLGLWSLLMTYKKSYMGFSKNPLLDLKIQDAGDLPS